MNSLNPQVSELHRAYCEAMAIDLPMTATFERWLLNLHNAGVSPDDLKLCVKARLSFNRTTSCKKGLELKHLCRDEDDIAVVINEVAVVRANARVKVVPPNKAQALRDAGLPDTMPSEEAKHIADVEVIKAIAALRKAAG